MGINTRTDSNKPGVFLVFVPLLGGLIVDTEESRGVVKTARDVAGAQQTDGFQGYKGNSASAKALTFLKGENIFPISSVSGVLRGIAYREEEKGEGANKFTSKLVFVTLRDNDENFTLKLDVNNTGTHKLLQKLAHVALNEQVEVSVFGTYGPSQKDPNGPSYTDYAASVKTAAGEVKVAEGAWNAVNEVAKSLEDQLTKIPGVTKEAISTAVRTAKADYFANMAKKLEADIVAVRETEKDDGVPF